MTIRQKLNLVTITFISTLTILSLVVFFGYRHVTTEASLANDLDNQSMYLQMMLRGLNEVLLNEGTPASIKTQNNGINGFDKIHIRLMEKSSDPEIEMMMVKIHPHVRFIKEAIKPFQNHYIDRTDTMMINAGKLIRKVELIITHVNEIAEKKRAVVNKNSKLSIVIEKTIFSVLFVLIIFLTYLARHIYLSINKPIEELTSIADGFNRGELDITMDESRKDEFGTLAKFFNKSTKKLRQASQSLTDRTCQLQLEQYFTKTIIQSMPGLFYIIEDKTGKFKRRNDNWRIVTGYSEDEIERMTGLDFFTEGSDRDECALRVQEVFNNGYSEMENELLTKSGDKISYFFNGHKVVIDKKTYLVGMGIDISKRKNAEKQINRLAYYDSLTGLPNRQLFTDRLNISLKDIKRNNGYGAVLFFDIDDFKRINDTLGHSIGDALLKEVSNRVTECIRENDSLSRQNIFATGTFSVSRLGGDEFIVLVTNIKTPQDAAMVAQRIMEVISSPFKLKDHEIIITISIGIAISPDDGLDVNTIVRNADISMYNAKNQGKNNYQFYTSAMNELIHKRLLIETNLRKAIENDEFQLYYQPRIDGQTGAVSSMEALIRWNRPGKGIVPPSEFIEVAESTGIIIPIGEWVLRTACAQNVAWQEAGMPPMIVSVNISGKQFQREDFMATVLKALDYSSLNPKHLELEVTENVLMNNVNANINTMKQLSELGIRIAIDDFGTGYSSFGYLKRFPVDILKIDKSFIDDIAYNTNDLAIVSAIILMGHSLDLAVVAEGVEKKEQLDLLLDLKCNEIQGYYYSRPLPADKFEDFVKKSTITSGERLDG